MLLSVEDRQKLTAACLLNEPGTIDLYNQVCSELLPTPQKLHYLFNLRDLCKVLQGLMRATPKQYDSKASFLKLWVHECTRVFHDRLIDDKDRGWFFGNLDSRLDEGFSTSIKTLFDGNSLSSYGSFMGDTPEFPVYEEYAGWAWSDYVCDLWSTDYEERFVLGVASTCLLHVISGS